MPTLDWIGKSPLLGVHDGTAIYLLFNGVMGDRRTNGGNVLTTEVLRKLPDPSPSQGEVRVRVIYGEGCRLSRARLKRANTVFKQVPYEIKVS
jgi:adenine-specific DNA-methyltransferase